MAYSLPLFSASPLRATAYPKYQDKYLNRVILRLLLRSELCSELCSESTKQKLAWGTTASEHVKLAA